MIKGLVSQGPKRHKGSESVKIKNILSAYTISGKSLPGIQNPNQLDCLVKQILDSQRRISFVKKIGISTHMPVVADPNSLLFDPLKAAVIRAGQGDTDDAVWLVFLAVHFGKHAKDGWALARLVYGRSGENGLWNWKSVSADPSDFCRWLAQQRSVLQKFRFSNHRKYESLDHLSINGTGAVVTGFVNWIKSVSSFNKLVRATHQRVGQDPTVVFDALYRDLGRVRRFGRLAKFDFLNLLGNLGIAPVIPGSAYIKDGATGPYLGIRLLVTGNSGGKLSRRDADLIYESIGQALGVGMQELEDSICNWQKCPAQYKYFRG